MKLLRDGFSALFPVSVGTAWRSSVPPRIKQKWELNVDQCSFMCSSTRLFWVTLAQPLAAHWHRQTQGGPWSHFGRTLVC